MGTPMSSSVLRRMGTTTHHLSRSASSSASAMAYQTRVIGAPNTLQHRVFIEKDGQVVSAFHDIPLFADESQGVLNMIVEVPRWTKAKGDNDPLDVCEIGESVGYVGQIKQVKILGIMALLDEGETDWKVIVVDVKDPLAPKLNDI